MHFFWVNWGEKTHRFGTVSEVLCTVLEVFSALWDTLNQFSKVDQINSCFTVFTQYKKT